MPWLVSSIKSHYRQQTINQVTIITCSSLLGAKPEYFVPCLCHVLLQSQHVVMQESLHYAEEAAAVATTECATLAAAVQAMTEQDAKARCGLAHRAHHLRDALLQTSAALRQFNDSDRKEHTEVGGGRQATEVERVAPSMS